MNQIVMNGLCLLVLAGCVQQDVAETATDTSGRPSVTIMTFNVENLFDTRDDPDKDDQTYLPRAVKSNPEHIHRCEQIEVERWRRDCLELDWSEDALEFKLSQLAKSILQVNNGLGPDILALQEVENADILTRLSRVYLQAAGYGDAILLEGRDQRGIDVAFLSRLPLVNEPVLHAFEVSGFPDRADDTRGVLEATFKLPDGSLLTGFSVHFPAPFHPTQMRAMAYDHLNALRRRIPDDHIVFAAGDFNTSRREKTETTIMDDRVRPFWRVAHEVDCGGCLGTSYWAQGKSWSFLDMILLSAPASGTSEWRIQKGGVYIADDYDDQLKEDGTVKRFNLAAHEGVSDHLPLVMTIERETGG